MKARAFLLLFPLFLLSLLPGALAAPHTLWSVGTPDRSGREFAIFQDYGAFPQRFPRDPAVTVGPDAARGWPYIHPGPVDAWAGSRQHTFRIGFNLPAPPQGESDVVLDVIGVHADYSPWVEVAVNGAPVWKRLAAGPGDVVLSDEKAGRPASYRFAFPPDAFRAGHNEVAITITSGSWILYDDVRLENDPDVAFQPITNVRLEPSPLFKRTGSGLEQVVFLMLNSFYKDAPAHAEMHVNGTSRAEELTLSRGENRIPFTLPEVAAPTPVSVTFRANGIEKTVDTTVTPQRKWTVFIDPSSHTDIGYTDHQDRVERQHNENTDTALKEMRTEPFYHWSLEVAWQAQNYLKDRPEKARQEFIQRAREGRLGIHAGYLNMLTGLMSDEELNRYVYYTASLHRKYGIDTSAATLTDVPSATWGLASALAESGIACFAEGVNQGRGATIIATGIYNPFWWEGPDGTRLLSFLAEGYHQGYIFNPGSTMASIQDALSAFVQRFDRPDYPYDAVYMFGAVGDNRPVQEGYASLLPKWNATWAYPKLILANTGDYFRYIRTHNPKAIPVVRGDFGAFWEDGAASSAAETAVNRRNQERIVAAETLWSLARLAGAKAAYPVDAFDRAWDDIFLYDEHTWGANQSISEPDSEQTRYQWRVKAGYAHNAAARTRTLAADGLRAYLAKAGGRRGDIVVVNTLSWPRTGLAKLPRALPSNVRLVDARGRAVPAQGGFFLARDVPAFGHIIYRVAAGTAKEPPVYRKARTSSFAVTNAFYGIRVEPGRGITSVVDRATGRELLDPSSRYAFGQVVYVAGGEDTSACEARGPRPAVVYNDGGDGLKPPAKTLLVTPARVTSATLEMGPLYTEVVMRGEAPAFPHLETRVRLYNATKRIDVLLSGTKTEIRRKEAVYVAFPFRAKKPAFHLGVPNASARPEADFIHGGCHNWYTVQNWVTLDDGADRVVWSSPDAPLVTLCDLFTGDWARDAHITNGSVFSYLMNNYWNTNYKAGQGGDFAFRFSLTSGRRERTPVPERFGREAGADLWTGVSPGISPGVFPGSPASAPKLGVDGPGVVVTTLKGAQDGRGMILRLRNASETPATARITLPAGRFRTERTDLVERTLSSLPVRHNRVALPLKRHQTASLRIVPAG